MKRKRANDPELKYIMGLLPREETLEERAVRLSQEIADEENRQALLDSTEGVQFANQEINNLYAKYEKFVNNFSDKNTTVKFQFQKFGNTIVVNGGGFSLELQWSSPISNTLKYSALYLRLWKGNYDASGRSVFPFEKPKLLKEMEYNFDLNKGGKKGWKESTGKKRFYLPERMIEKSMDMLFDQIRYDKIKQ